MTNAFGMAHKDKSSWYSAVYDIIRENGYDPSVIEAINICVAIDDAIAPARKYGMPTQDLEPFIVSVAIKMYPDMDIYIGEEDD